MDGFPALGGKAGALRGEAMHPDGCITGLLARQRFGNPSNAEAKKGKNRRAK